MSREGFCDAYGSQLAANSWQLPPSGTILSLFTGEKLLLVSFMKTIKWI